MKINETWSAVDLRVEAFSLIVEAFCQQRLVLISGGSSSLPGEAGKREKVVAFCRWVPAYWYESAPVHVVRIFLNNKN